MKNILKLLFLIAVFISFQSCSKNQNTTGGKTDSAGNNTSSNTNSSTGSTAGKSPEEIMSNGFQITYNITGMMSGNADITVKNNKSKMEMKYSMQGQNVNMKNFTDSEYIYMMMDMGDFKQNTKMRIKDKTKKDPSQIDYAALKEELKKYKKIGTETIIGKECDIYEMSPGATISVYDNMIPLKIKTEGMTMEATELDLDESISESDVAPPADVTFKEVNY